MNVSSPIIEPIVDSKLKQAHALMHKGAFSDAIRCLTPMVKAMQLEKPTPDEIFALLMMADAQRFGGQPRDAYQNYVIASELDPNQAARLEKHILQCISEMQQPILSPTFEQHLIQYLHKQGLENIAVDRLAINLLKAKFKLDDDNATLEFSDILAYQFLPEAVSHLVLADAKVESFLNQLRHQVFTLAIETDLANELQPLVIALAEHGALTEYAFPVDDAERVILLGIKTLLETEVIREDDLKQHLGSLLLYGMFEPLTRLACCRTLSISSLADWPTSVQPLLKKIFVDRATEHSLSGSIAQLSEVTEEVSKAVMNMYESNPYPRWDDIFITDKKVSYLGLYPNLDAAIQKPKKFNKHLDCLIAGAGTGKQPLWLAANCRDIRITALDLSLPSLCYAKRQSLELGIDNIEFIQGDILELELMENKFDVIECSGVLHHMQDPELGLKNLLKRLRKDGLLRIGLYSRIARDKAGITAARVDNPNANLDDIRATRRHLLSNPGDILNLSRDFYTTSECRDLLFHVQEHQYAIPEIKSMLERNHLAFLGFSPLKKDVQAAFHHRFGSDADTLNLDNWHQFEQENPLIFKGMYQFHCQKRS